ncbi:hypothetical protein WICPIJ_000239 [Wickerhamomyces pijperi]|uniref:Ribonuclease T2-like n=1 Tax=Wickerhamomyces pijperi TaxID=599730 RepID=A0A9P8QHC6_WICPI|nr:hypothetical protein WICPIJ_000239 [Wickerhamomyces pijperi]
MTNLESLLAFLATGFSTQPSLLLDWLKTNKFATETSPSSDLYTPPLDFQINPNGIIENLSCPRTPQLSCSVKNPSDLSGGQDLCCFEYPGGLVLQTQFWNYDPALGGDDQWTIHGLWPDNCDGSYEEFCDSSLDIKPEEIEPLLKQHGALDLLQNMKDRWFNNEGPQEELWAHEFNKHATCYSTLKPSCYSEQEAESKKYIVDYFNITMNLYEQLPTFDILAEAGVVPSHSQKYDTKSTLAALKNKFGKEVHLGCDSRGGVNEIWYYFNAFGSLRNENYRPTDTTFGTTCGETFYYYPKMKENTTTAASEEPPSKIQPPSHDGLSCPTSLPLSCSNTTVIENSCCFESGGIILQTQFWDYSPATGPNDTFTLHGLWPDDCGGGYQQYCDSSMNIKNPRALLETFEGGKELVQDMVTYWKDFRDNDDYLWEHEFNKHATCFSTLNQRCFGDSYVKNEAVFDFFNISMNLFKTVPTYDWLLEEGIYPSTTKEYTKEEILGALRKHYGFEPFISCDYHNNLNQVWYYHLLQGSILSEQFVRIDSMNPSRCRATGIKFMPKVPRRVPIKPTTTLHGPPKPTSPGNRGTIKLSGQPGCLIKNGKWYVSGSCAGYTLNKLGNGSVTIKSSAGFCSVVQGIFTCSSMNHQPFEFDYDAETGSIGVNGEFVWHSDEIAKRFKQVAVQVGKGGDAEFKLHFI